MKPPENKQYVLFGGTFVLANKMQLVADRMMEGLSVKQWFVLRTLLDMPTQPPPTIHEVAAETDTSRQNTAKMLETLQKQGYVDIGPSETDGRSRAVRITAEGRRMTAQSREGSGAFFAQLFAGIPGEECATAAKVLMQMAENLDKMKEACDEKDRG